jgi:hypothetical protein
VVAVVLGLLALLAGLVALATGRDLVELLLFVALPMAPYLVTHMNLRYAYLVHFTGVLAVILAAETLRRRWGR